MRRLVLVAISLFSISAMAEHDATYCGKLLAGTTGKMSYEGSHPELVIAVECRIRNAGGECEEWEKGFGAILGIPRASKRFVTDAIKSSQTSDTLFCVKARWGGAAYSSTDINEISLITDSVNEIGYQSDM